MSSFVRKAVFTRIKALQALKEANLPFSQFTNEEQQELTALEDYIRQLPDRPEKA